MNTAHLIKPIGADASGGAQAREADAGTAVAEKKRPRRKPNRFTELVLGPDGPQRFNLVVSMTGLCTYLACLALIWYCEAVGMVDHSVAVPTSVGLVVTVVGFYVALRTGWSRRLSDPGMALPQMLTSVTWDCIGYAITHEVHGAMLMPVAVTVTYGVFSLRGPAVRKVQAYTLIVVGVTMAWMHMRAPDMFDLRVEVVSFASLALSVLMVTWLARQLADLRARQREQRGELNAALARIEKHSTHDLLTGLYNRRHINALLDHHLARTRRSAGLLTVALLDLDRFKQVNDTHGHGVGDEMLKTFAHVARTVLGDNDVVARWGGEEFLILSTDRSEAELRAVIDQIREQFVATPVSQQLPALRGNFSAGVASLQADANPSAIVERADRALYAAKAAGRGCTVLAGEVPASVPANSARLAMGVPG